MMGSSLAWISRWVRPKMEALMRMFSLPVMSGWKPAPSSIRLEIRPRVSMCPLVG